ncbi:hypothetical protein, partial [Salmonella enterica]|uniref:hypothetical protein n=1 Tax=Salmonella enterica TaxID=28901 RepID=UPI001E33ED05
MPYACVLAPIGIVFTYALRVRFSANRYSLAIRQEVCAMMALNMLRRWLNGEDITSEHGWIDVV